MQNYMPPRDYPGLSTSSQVFTNIYELRTDSLPPALHLYRPHPDCKPSLDLVSHYRRYARDKEHIYQQIGYVCRYRGGFLGKNKVGIGLKMQDVRSNEDDSRNEVQLEGPKQIRVEELIAEQGGSHALRTMFGPALKKTFGKKAPNTSMYEFGPFHFHTTSQHRLTLTYFNRKLWLTTDTLLKINENCPVLYYLEKYQKSEAASLLTGRKVMKTYGDRQSYYIKAIDYEQNPTSKMPEGEETFQEYYLRKYERQLSNLTQPLIVAQRYPVQTQSHKDAGRQSQKDGGRFLFLIPELMALEDRSQQPDYPQETGKKLRQLKQLVPAEKEAGISEVVSALAAEEVIKKSAIKLETSVLVTPKILMNNCEIQPEEGIFEFRNRIKHSPDLRSWAVAYSSQRQNSGVEEANRLIGYFRDLTRTYGVGIRSNPSEIVIGSCSLEDWKATLESNFKKFGNLQVIVLVLREEEEKLYGKLKELLSIRLKCISQVIRRSTILYSKKPYAIATEAMIQMITKVGAVPWSVQPVQSVLSQSLVMQGGLYFNQQDSLHSYSLVGHTNREHNQVHSAFRGNLKCPEEVKKSLDSIFHTWAKRFVMNVRDAPDTLILFRETNRPQSKTMIAHEISSLEALTKKVGEKLKKANYAPSIVYVMVERQKDIEFYAREEIAGGSMTFRNVDCGTVYFEEGKGSRQYSFYLNAQSSPSVTLRPVRFRVVSSSERVGKEELAQFTYEQCYNYFNYQGSMPVPAVLQSANKLRRLSQQFGHELESESKLTQYPYFL